jgi:hypothetical protein
MKKLLILLSLLVPFILSAQQQQEDTLRYMKYPNAYGPQYTTGWFTKLFRLPDTASMRPQHGVPGAFGRNADGTKTFSWDGDEWIGQNVSSIDSMFISSTDSIFIIRDGDTTFIGLNGSHGVDTVYSSNDSLYGVKNGVTFFIDNLQFFPNGLNQPGYVTWSGSGLTFDVTAAIFTIDQTTYSSASGSITLDLADQDNPRYDVIAVDTTGAIVKITGTAGVNPSIPQVDPNSQIYLTAVYIAAGATIPGDVVQNIIYDENTESYTGVATGVTVNLNNTINPFHLVKSANVNAWTSGGKTLVFTKNSGLDDINNYSVLKLFIYLKAAISGSANIRVSFYNGSTAVSNVLTLGNGNGFSKATSGAYQNVTVPLSAFTFSSAIFDKLRITFAGNAGGAYIDYVQLQGGITQPNPSQIYQDTTYKRNDTLFGLKNNKEFFIAKDIRDTAKLSAGWPLYFADVDNFYAPNGLNKAITIDSSALSDYIVQIINNDTTTGLVVNNATFIVKYHSDAPVPGDNEGDKYLVSVPGTGDFLDQDNNIATKVGGIYSFQIPEQGDQLIVNNSNTYETFIFNGTTWDQLSIVVLAGGNTGIGDMPIGTKDATDLHLITNGTTAVLIDTNSNVSITKFIGTRSNNFTKFDSATGNLDTGFFRLIVAGTGITITHGPAEDTISASSGGNTDSLFGIQDNLGLQDRSINMQGHNFEMDSIDFTLNNGDIGYTGDASYFHVGTGSISSYVQKTSTDYSDFNVSNAGVALTATDGVNNSQVILLKGGTASIQGVLDSSTNAAPNLVGIDIDGNWYKYAASISGAAGGDLSGTYPDPNVTGIRGSSVPTLSAGNLKYTGIAWSFDNTSYVPDSRTITINGTTFDLSANRSWTISTGSSTFASLTDVNFTSLANGNLVKYNSSSGKWENFVPTYISSYTETDPLSVPLTRTINGLALSANQTFATGTSGSDFNISSVSTTHTFNIPDASGSNRGLVTTGSQTFAGQKIFSSAPRLTSLLTGITGDSTLVIEGGIIKQYPFQLFDTSKAYIWTGNPHTWNIASIGTASTSNPAIYLNNTTAATSGVQNQYSPSIKFGSSYWNGSSSTLLNGYMYFSTSGAVGLLNFNLSGQILQYNNSGQLAVPSLITAPTVYAPTSLQASLLGTSLLGSGAAVRINTDQSYSEVGVNRNCVTLGASGTNTMSTHDFVNILIQQTYNQSGTVNSYDLLIDRKETAVPSTIQRLIDAGTNSGTLGTLSTHTTKFYVSNIGNVGIYRPLVSNGSTPSNSLGTGAGTSPTASITGNDISGYVTINTGTSPTASGDIITITFATALTNTPTSIQLTPANEAAATELTKFYADQSSASSSSFKIKNTSSALTGSTTYKFYYTIIQ